MSYLIEFRLRGFAKRYSQGLIKELGYKFKTKGMKNKKSHITLYGPFTTNNEKKMISRVLKLCKEYDRIYFSIKGINYFNNPKNKVVYLDIVPSEDLKEFRFKLASILKKITKTKSKEDVKTKNQFSFHSTIAFKDIDYKLEKILNHLKRKNHPKIRQTLLRVTILKNGKILREYDFLLNKMLNRGQALSKNIFRETISKLKQEPLSRKMNKSRGIKPKQTSIWNKIKLFFGT